MIPWQWRRPRMTAAAAHLAPITTPRPPRILTVAGAPDVPIGDRPGRSEGDRALGTGRLESSRFPHRSYGGTQSRDTKRGSDRQQPPGRTLRDWAIPMQRSGGREGTSTHSLGRSKAGGLVGPTRRTSRTLGTFWRALPAVGGIGQPLVQPLTQLVGGVMAVYAALARDDDARRGDTREAGEADDLPRRAHRSHRLVR